MEAAVVEALYPLQFRKEEAERLGDILQQRHCVNLIGMKRVGISNFLRFFLYRKDIVQTYISKDQKHLFIPVDLNDLVEREIYPFWTLTMKRIVDASNSSDLPEETKQMVNALFVKSIQSQDLFLVIDNIRQALCLIVEKGLLPTIFFIRFDRLKDAFNPSFFDNLEGLREATHENLAYVFTSYRSIGYTFPTARTKLARIVQNLYIGHAQDSDMKIIYESYRKRFNFTLDKDAEKVLFSLVKGNIQYLQLALIILNEKKNEKKGDDIESEDKLRATLLCDERINLQSEELWESLSSEEKKVLAQIVKKQKISEADKEKALYLYKAGFVIEENGQTHIYSTLFEHYVSQVEKEAIKKNHVWHLTRKENLLFNLLKSQLGDICERERIIETVWPEYHDLGVSDWAIDRLVARVRLKLREQQNPYEIITVRTRGYKLALARTAPAPLP